MYIPRPEDKTYILQRLIEPCIRGYGVPAVRIIIEAIDGAITAREAYIVKASDSQATIYANIHEVLLLPSLNTQHKIVNFIIAVK